MPVRKRQSGSSGKKSDYKKKRRDTAEEKHEPTETDNFFLDDDEGAPPQEEEEIEEAAETTEQKRLRLAKAYLKQLRSSGADLGEDDDDHEELELDDDELGAKLKRQAQEAGGYLQRQLAARISVPEDEEASTSGRSETTARFHRCHRGAVTALALTQDDATVYSVGKEGSIIRLDVETGSRTTVFKPGKGGIGELPSSGPEWVKKGPRHLSAGALLAVAVSSDGRLLAVGGGDRKVHVWDTASHSLIQSYPGHKDAITGLAFRQGTHDLYSCSYDRSIKLWSLDDRAYVDTLFGHQAEVLAIDALRQERVVSCGHDHTCRVWKIAEESQLIYRGHATAIDCCRYVTGTEWVTGSNDGTLALWSQLKKKPAWRVHDAHRETPENPAVGAGFLPAEAGWIQSVGVCRGSDLVASGAADGFVRLWQVTKSGGTAKTLDAIGQFPAKGYVNALAIATSARFVVAGLGQEPRLGRWGHDKSTRCGLLVQPLELAEE